jgi:cytoskeletal protein RodZ
LRDRRRALGISLVDAENATRIRGKLLAALEEGEYDRLPNPGYVRGYISSYARFLELDPVPLLNMYKAEAGTGPDVSLNLPQAGPRVVAPTGQQHAFPLKAGLVIAASVALLILLIWGAVRLFRGPEPTAPVPNTPTTSEPSSTKEPSGTAPAQTPTEPVAKKPFTLTVKVSPDGASWLRIEVDGQHAYEGVLTAGQQKKYEVTDRASVRAGKPEWVTVEKDGVRVPMKKTGGVAVATIVASTVE